MKLTTLADVYNMVKYNECEEIIIDEETRLAAKKPLDRMIEFGG